MIRFYLQIVFFFLISCQGNFSKVKEASFDDFYNSKMNKILIDVRTLVKDLDMITICFLNC